MVYKNTKFRQLTHQNHGRFTRPQLEDSTLTLPADEFELYDLRVEVVVHDDRKIQCSARVGDYFEARGEVLHFPPGQGFSMYSLAALLPLLPAKQRVTQAADWMSTDAEVACPDPHCPTRFRITRLSKRRFKHSDTTAVPLHPGASS